LEVSDRVLSMYKRCCEAAYGKWGRSHNS